MPFLSNARFGWRAVLLIASTYIYFLIYAQFGFLARMTQLEVSDEALKPVMGIMAIAGIATSLWAGYTTHADSACPRLITAFVLCGVSALATSLRLPLPAFVVVAAVIGAGLGLLTVTLVTFLNAFTGQHPLLEVSLGTGLAYFCCNVPAIFTATPGTQSLVAVGVCALGLMLCMNTAPLPVTQGARVGITGRVPTLLFGFALLVWFDSAAFFIIQHSALLKAGTWAGNVHLWMNASLHFAAAVSCRWLLQRFGVASVQALAATALCAACLLIDAGHVPAASVLYPIGVSVYSVALVAYPGFLSNADSFAARGRQAAWLYAIAGWVGSAMGIGMAQHLYRIPIWFIAIAGTIIIAPSMQRAIATHARELVASATLVLVALAAQHVSEGSHGNEKRTAVERGRRVYIDEGCIHCHSQYVRPHSSDVLLWGPAQSIAELREQHPPLIGNRRQGPDLSEVGNRRSQLWITAHFEDPRALIPQSFMPSYAYLFEDGNTAGPDLVAYLGSLHTSAVPEHLAQEASWVPATFRADPLRGRKLYEEYCQTCHDPNGAIRRRWDKSFRVQPPNLLEDGSIMRTSATPSAQLARIIKFGIHGTDMPGHEYLPDEDIAALTSWLQSPPS